MTSPKATPFTLSARVALTGGADELFAAVAWNGTVERVVSNPSATNSIWIAFDRAPAANTAGSILLGPGQTVSFQTSSQVQVLGTAASPVTGYERVD